MLGTRSFRAERPRRKGEPVCIQDEEPKENEAPHAHAMRMSTPRLQPRHHSAHVGQILVLPYIIVT